MSATIPNAQAFSIGKDTKVVVIFGGGLGIIRFRDVTGFHATPVIKKIREPVLNGPTKGVDLYDGWNGGFDLLRANATADNLATTLEQMFWSGQPIPGCQIYQYISEVNGSTTTYEFSPGTMSITNPGKWQQETAVHQMAEFYAERRRPV